MSSAIFLLTAVLWPVSAQLPNVYQEGVLQPYTSYSDVALFRFHVPAATSLGKWEFAAYHDSIGCPIKLVHLYLQHGSYPVINPQNASVPSELYLQRSRLHHLTVATGPRPHQPTRLHVPAPLDGEWYAAAYIPGWDRAVTQQGITHRCSYNMGSIAYWQQERPQLLQINQPITIRTIARQSYFKFHVPSDAESVSVTVSGCRVVEPSAPPEDDVHPCLAWVGLRPRALPTLETPGAESLSGDRASQWGVRNVRSNGSYRLEPEQLWRDAYYYLTLVAESSAELRITVTLTQCEYVPTGGRAPAADVTPSQLTVGPRDRAPSSVCEPVTRLTRIKYARDFTDTFLAVNAAYYHTWLELSDQRLSSVQFETRQFEDVGGTLHVDLQLSKLIMGDSRQLVTVSGCVSPHVLPITAAGQLRCDPQLSFNLSTASEAQTGAVRLLPFPEPATWYITMETRCRSAGSGAVLPCVRSKYSLNLDVHMQPCVWPDAPCGDHGVCRENHRGQLYFTACSCLDGYRGWDCSDGSAAVPSSRRLLAVCLLTLSNLALLPAVLLAARRRLPTLALVYSAAMLFSMLYHLCDQLGRQRTGSGYCLLQFEALQFCDFFCCVLSCWVTLISLGGWAEPPLHMLGAVAVAAAVRVQPTALWVFLAPVLAATFVTLGVFAARGYWRGRLKWPSRSWLLYRLLPGLVLALIAIIIFTGFETVGNYQYTHSAWHVTLGLALLLLLPAGGDTAARPADRRPLVPPESSYRHELDELAAARDEPTFCRPAGGPPGSWSAS